MSLEDDKFELTVAVDPDQVLDAYPYFTREKLNTQPLTIFGRKKKHLSYLSSDQLFGDDPGRATKAAQFANQSGARNRTQRWFETCLTAYFGFPVVLQHIMVGFRGDGKSYRVFGYRAKRCQESAQNRTADTDVLTASVSGEISKAFSD